MSLTPTTPVLAGHPSSLLCVITQGELFALRARADGARAALLQLAARSAPEAITVQAADGRLVEVALHSAIAAAVLRDLFGIDGAPAAAGPQEPAEPAASTAPPRTAWRPTVVKGGQDG